MRALPTIALPVFLTCAALACSGTETLIGDSGEDIDTTPGGQVQSGSHVEPPAAPKVVDKKLDAHQAGLLQKWYDAVGTRRNDESFGSLIARAGRLQLSRRYIQRESKPEIEHLRIDLESFQCVSFVESTLALARCTWTNERNESCFIDEVRESRYRDGTIDGYPSRLHYFTDWIANNAARHRIDVLGETLGATKVRQPFGYMTAHPKSYPAMNTDEIRSAIRAAELRLSETDTLVVGRDAIRDAQAQLQDGDLIAFVGNKPGILITHAGFITQGPRGEANVMHASSYHKKVLLGGSVADYVLRKPKRLGIVVSRPTPPSD